MMLKWYGGLIRLNYLDCDNGIKKKIKFKYMGGFIFL